MLRPALMLTPSLLQLLMLIPLSNCRFFVFVCSKYGFTKHPLRTIFNWHIYSPPSRPVDCLLIASHVRCSSLYKQQLAHQQALFHQFQQQAQGANFGGAQGGPNGFYAPNFAGSSASHGPGGFHQTASITPANPVIKMDG